MPSDPARLSSTQASFRLRLPAPVAPMIDAPSMAGVPQADAFGRPYAPLAYAGRPGLVRAGGADTGGPADTLGGGVPRRKGRVTAVTWTGQAMPGDAAATQLLDAVRLNSASAPVGAAALAGGGHGGLPLGGGSSVGLADPGSTQLLDPEWDDTLGGSYGRAVPRQQYGPGMTGPGGPGGAGYGGYGAGRPAEGRPPRRPEPPGWAPTGELPQYSASTGEPSRHAWYPGRRVDLGLVLLPLRVLLGSLSVYAGFSKLCDPVYFDGGDRGSMMRWLSSLHPWRAAEPLLAFAMAHPVGAGLGVAFTEVVVGVLSLLGLWQRLAAATAMALSAALLFTVSWRAVPVYDTPDLIFLAAWSPLLIAGAPFASLDGRLALEAWRRYGAAPKAVRRRVLRRGSVVASVVIGLTLLCGSLLGAAVRTGGQPQPRPTRVPSNNYGTPVWPTTGGTGGASHAPVAGTRSGPAGGPTPSVAPSATPSAAPTPSTAAKAPKAHPSAPRSTAAGRAGEATGSSGQGGGSTSGTGTASQPGTAGSSGSAGSGTGTRVPKPTPSGGGLLGSVLGSGPPAVSLVGMSDAPASSGRGAV
ncbi:DoxX family membrane protein [Kitasatospora sp. NPDC052896]|uniref:DoxX family membrane protein n=1 Tax=Kitasatospora sp. NPDC052896 TaxID=3364061 RepID=UPI0037CBFB1B